MAASLGHSTMWHCGMALREKFKPSNDYDSFFS